MAEQCLTACNTSECTLGKLLKSSCYSLISLIRLSAAILHIMRPYVMHFWIGHIRKKQQQPQIFSSNDAMWNIWTLNGLYYRAIRIFYWLRVCGKAKSREKEQAKKKHEHILLLFYDFYEADIMWSEFIFMFPTKWQFFLYIACVMRVLCGFASVVHLRLWHIGALCGS